MSVAIWIKQSGVEIELNDRDATIEKAVDLGWKLKSGKKAKAAPKKAAAKSVKKK
jgi:hypothetical protein